MFIHMSLHYPSPGKEQHVIDALHRFRNAMKDKPGLQHCHTMRDATTGKLIRIAIWNSREEWDRARPELQEMIKNYPLHEWEEVPPKVYHLEEV